MAQHAELTVEEAPLLALRDAWIELEERARTRNVFVSWNFLSTWWEHFRRQRQPRVFVVRERDARVVAILPFYIEVRSLRLGTVSVLRNVGYADVVNPDFLDVLVEPGYEDAVARAVAPHLLADESWEYAELSELEPAGSLPRIARVWEKLGGLEIKVDRRGTCPFVELPDDFETYLMSRNSHFRHQLRRYRRKIQRELKVEWRRVGTEVGVGDAMVALGRLHQERMEATDRGGNFKKKDYMAFHRDLAERLSPDGMLHFWLLYVEGEPIATHYGFLYGKTYYGYQMGFSPRYHRWSPGHYMTGVVIEKLIESGVTEMNLLRGSDSWKFRWTKSTRDTVTYNLIRPGWRSRAAYVKASLSAPPAIALRFAMGRDGFEELRAAIKRTREFLSSS